MVFASAYAAYLRYYGLDDVEQGTWQDFFASDVSAQLAVAAVEDVTVYRTTLKALLRSLEDPELPASAPAVIAALGAVFDCLGTLARRLETTCSRVSRPPSRCGPRSATSSGRSSARRSSGSSATTWATRSALSTAPPGRPATC